MIDLEMLLWPFRFGFMQNAFLISMIVSVPTALLSCFLVLKGWALMGDAVSHAVLPGIVLAYVIGAPLLLGAFVAGMVCALATGYVSDNSRIKQDTVMGVVFCNGSLIQCQLAHSSPLILVPDAINLRDDPN